MGQAERGGGVNLCQCGCGERANKRFVRGHHTRGRDNTVRDRDMVIRYASGLENLEQIGARYGVTRERARQIVRDQEKRTGFSAHAVRRAPRPTPYSHRPTAIERFFANVKINHETECWEWIGAVNKVTGYAQFNCAGEQYGHRFSVVTFKDAGAFTRDDGRTHTDHLCKVRHCVNPDHLEVVTARVNVLRSERPIYSQAALIQMLRWLALRLNRTPTDRDISAMLPCSSGPYVGRWGNIATAQAVVGLTPNSGGRSAPLTPSFRGQHMHLLGYLTPEEVAEHAGGLLIQTPDLLAA